MNEEEEDANEFKQDTDEVFHEGHTQVEDMRCIIQQGCDAFVRGDLDEATEMFVKCAFNGKLLCFFFIRIILGFVAQKWQIMLFCSTNNNCSVTNFHLFLVTLL